MKQEEVRSNVGFLVNQPDDAKRALDEAIRDLAASAVTLFKGKAQIMWNTLELETEVIEVKDRKLGSMEVESHTYTELFARVKVAVPE